MPRQDGLFDGMSSLYQLSLTNNLITTIGLNVFTAKAGLCSLHDIYLQNNALTSLEPWPLIRGQLISGSSVNLESNGIAIFTNRLDWSFRCGMKWESMTLDLRKNPFEHVADLTDGWNTTGEFQLSTFVCTLTSLVEIVANVQFSIWNHTNHSTLWLARVIEFKQVWQQCSHPFVELFYLIFWTMDPWQRHLQYWLPLILQEKCLCCMVDRKWVTNHGDACLP